MALTDTAIRAAKPKDKPYKLSDSAGLYLMINPMGSRLWRLKYRLAGKEKVLAIGAYPAVSLATAREKREHAKTLLAQGLDLVICFMEWLPTMRFRSNNQFSIWILR